MLLMRLPYYLLMTMRPKQWTKNTFLFVGIIFSGNLGNIDLLAKVAEAFVLFCLVSGCVYIINDIVDFEKDKKHPRKSLRPIAAGKIGRIPAAIAAAAILAASLTLSFMLEPAFGLIAVIYLLMNLAYSFALKHIVILDVMVIALGFIFRALAGTFVIQVETSRWLIVCTFFLSVFLALCKRRQELIVMEQMAVKTRLVLKEYTPDMLDQMISVVTASSLMAYALYTIDQRVEEKLHTPYLYFTIPFTLFGIFRYLYLVHKKNLGGSPELILLTDAPMILNLFLWLITVVVILYNGATV